MSLTAQWAPYRLHFTFEAITSRARMHHKDTYLLRVHDTASGRTAVGECALFRGLSHEDTPRFEEELSRVCRHPDRWRESTYSSVRFGFESALVSLHPSPATIWEQGRVGIPVNGLVWMGSSGLMQKRIDEKLEQGFRVIKLKIGALGFEDELALISSLRRRYSASDLEIRLDANGAFSPDCAPGILSRLAPLKIHSIEQPIAAGQWDAMARICGCSPIPVALDEELIGYRSPEEAAGMLDAIRPQYIILKPSLCGGFEAADNYISQAQTRGIGWWATSALESNFGLYAIGRWLSAKSINMPQGLGTGALYSNNFKSPLYMDGASLWCCSNGEWGDTDSLPWRI